MMRWVIVLIALVATGCGQVEGTRPVAAGAAAAATTHADAERGRAVYNYRCYFCHGYSGNAKTVAAEYLAPRPRDFTADGSDKLTEARIADAVGHGKPGTAMKSFAGILSSDDIRAVAAFVHDEFVVKRALNTRYHTAQNGWPNHERYTAAFPFARGEIALDAPAEQLSDTERAGLKLFMGACVSCHDQGRKTEDTARWELRPVSYPPNASSCLSCHNREGASIGNARPADHSPTYAGRKKPSDTADPHEIHDRPLQLRDLTPRQREGERLYQANCAFCHAADGTGKNWIGAFIEPHPANFTDAGFMAKLTRERMRRAISEGVSGASMPAWKGVLTPAQIEAVIDYVARAFLPLAGEAPAAPSAAGRS